MLTNKRIDHGILIPLALAGLLLVTAFVHQDLVLSFQTPVATGDPKSAIVFFSEVPGLSGGSTNQFLYRRRDQGQTNWTDGTRSAGHVADATFTDSGLVVLFDRFYSLYDRHTRKRLWSFDYTSLGFRAFSVTRLTGDQAMLFGIDDGGSLRAALLDGRSASAMESAKLPLPQGQTPIQIGSASSDGTQAVVAISLGRPSAPTGPLSIRHQKPADSSESLVAPEATSLLLIPFDGKRFGEPWSLPVVPKVWSLCREPQTASLGESTEAPATSPTAPAAATPPPGIILAMWPAPNPESLVDSAGKDSEASSTDSEAVASAPPNPAASTELGLWRVDNTGRIHGQADRIALTQPGVLDGLLENIWGEGEQPTVEVVSGLDRLLIFTQANGFLHSASAARGADGRYSLEPSIELAAMSTASRTLIWGWALLLLALLVVIALKLRTLSSPRPPEADSVPPAAGPPGHISSNRPSGEANDHVAEPPPPSRSSPDEQEVGSTHSDVETEAAPTTSQGSDSGANTQSTQRRAHAVRSYLQVQQMMDRPQIATATERAMAFGLDLLLCWGCLALLLAPESAANGYWTRLAWDVPEDRVITLLIGALGTWAYCTVSEAAFSQTLGKRLLGLKVTTEDGSPISTRSALVRNALRLGLLVDMLHLVDLFSISVSTRHQRLGDLLAGTLVRRIPGLAPFDDGDSRDTKDDPHAQA